MIIIISLMTFYPASSDKFCKASVILSLLTSALAVIPASMVLGVRTYALFFGCTLVKTLVWTLWALESMAFLVIVVLIIAHTRVAHFQEPTVCILHITSMPYTLAVVSCCIAMVYDMALWSMVAVKMYHLMTSGASKLVWAFYRDGPLYITVITIVNVAQVCIRLRMHAGREVLQGLLNVFELVLVSNYTCRLLLDLRETVMEEGNIDNFTLEILACQTGMVENLDLQFANEADTPSEQDV